MTAILIGSQEVKCVWRETAVLSTFSSHCERLFLDSEWQHQQNSGVTASHGEVAALTSQSV